MAYNKLKAHEYYMKHRKLKGKKRNKSTIGIGVSSGGGTGIKFSSGAIRSTSDNSKSNLATASTKPKFLTGAKSTSKKKKKSTKKR